MIRYSCDMCGRSLVPDEDDRYVVKIEVYAACDSVDADCEDEEFWEFYHENNPANRKSKDFKKYWSIISPKGVISIDPHPNEKANKIALKLIEDYFIGE